MKVNIKLIDSSSDYYKDLENNGKIIDGFLEIDSHKFMEIKKKHSGFIEIDTITNFMNSMKRWAESGLSTVNENEQQRRLDICEKCPFFTGSTCKLCGCFIKFKKKLLTEKCPDGRW